MSIAAFYRTYIPFVQSWTYEELLEPVVVQTPPTWVKVNIQPFKRGLMLSLTEFGTVYNDWKTIYTRSVPEFDLSNIPSNARLVGTYAYFNGRWFTITATQDWTTAGRAPKHYEYTAVASTGNDAITWPEPVPLATLVESFEAVVRELQQTSIILNELTEE